MEEELTGDDIIAAMRAWQPGVVEFVIVAQPDWERIQNAVEGAGIGAQLDGITVMPVELDAES